MNPTHLPKLVIFDCDGVLIDSEPIFLDVLHGLLCSYGTDLSFQQCWDLFVGTTVEDVEAYMRKHGVNFPQDWVTIFRQNATAKLEKEVKAVEGVQQVIEQLQSAGVPLCVASNGYPQILQTTLKRTELLRFFKDRIFSAYTVGASKPAPDLFLHAAKTMGVAPTDCVVIEDSASGLQAAALADMTCFAYTPPHMHRPADLFGASPFNTMSELPEKLGFVRA